MRGVLSIERTRREPSGRYRNHLRGHGGTSQPSEAPAAGGIPAKSAVDSGRLGYRGESPERCSKSPVCDSGAGAVEAVPRARWSASETRTSDDGGVPHGFLKTALLALLCFYRSALSPAIPSSCRFYPTCSAYAYEAVSQWGIRRGIWLAVRRVVRCRPFGSFGYDPVPASTEGHGS
jgi:putative membrane protein insertion efficiency factor